MVRRITVFCIALAILLWGAVAPGLAKVRVTHYTYVGHGEKWFNYLEDRAKVFMAQHPDIEIEFVRPGATAEYATKFTVMLAAGTPPDVTDFHPALGGTHIINGVFADLRPFLAKDNINLQQITAPYVTNVLTTNTGAIWGLPADIYPIVTYFNKDIFNNIGSPFPSELGANWTWDRALNVGRKATIDKNSDGNPEQWGFDRMWARWYMWVQQAGGRLYDRVYDPTQSYWNTPEVVRGLNFPLTVMRDGLGPKSNTAGVKETYFWFGRTAIDLVDGPGITGDYLKTASFGWDIAPQINGPVNSSSEITVDAFEMLEASPHKAEAWQWLKFISLDVESQAKFVEYTGRAPSLSVLQRRYQQLVPYLPANYMAYFVSAAAPGTQLNYILLKQTEVNAIVNPMITQIFAGQIPVETAVAQIQEKVSAILAGK